MNAFTPNTRRSFIKSTALLTGAFAIGASKGASPNSDIRVAVVGLRGRGKSLIKDVIRTEGATLAAICDADTAILAERLSKVEEEFGIKPDTVDNYRKVLDRKDIDAVVLTTPNHLHAIQTIWACQAGKDVYVEKPVCHSVWEGRKMVEAAAKYDRIVQAGFQNRSDVGLKEAFAWIKEGNIGKIKEVRGLCYRNRASIGKVDTPLKAPDTVDYEEWLGPADDLPMHRESFHYDWHWVWNTGNGDFGNQGPHELDLTRWILDDPGHPNSITSIGGRFGWNDGGETPNMHIAKIDYGTIPVHFEVRDLWVKPETNAAANFKGSRVGVVVTCEGGEFRGGRGGGIIYDKNGEKRERFKGSGGYDHFPAFIRGVNSRKESDLACTIETGFMSSCLSHWGNIPLQMGEQVSKMQIEAFAEEDPYMNEAYRRFSEHLDAWNLDTNEDRWTIGSKLLIDGRKERFKGAGASKANKWVVRKGRKGFEIPDRV
ncbi:MAG: Gfo/Idh/MocA family oxidoreductase [Verrucomicrobiota bacterium]